MEEVSKKLKRNIAGDEEEEDPQGHFCVHRGYTQKSGSLWLCYGRKLDRIWVWVEVKAFVEDEVDVNIH